LIILKTQTSAIDFETLQNLLNCDSIVKDTESADLNSAAHQVLPLLDILQLQVINIFKKTFPFFSDLVVFN